MNNILKLEQPQKTNINRERIKEKKPIIPIYTVIFFTLFLVNTIVPLFDLPLIGLSITSPFMLFIALQVILKPSAPWFEDYKKWWIFAGAIWICWFITAVVNSTLGRLEVFSLSQVLYFTRTAYWLIVMIITTYIISQKINGVKLLQILNFGIFVLGALRLFEAIFYGRIGAGTSEIISQNGYGVLFSSFGIFPLILLIESKGINKFFQLIVVCVVFSSAIINSSRSNWVALLVGVFVVVYFAWRANKIKFSKVALVVYFGIFLYILYQLIFSDQSVVINPNSSIVKRLETFRDLEMDQSLGTRQYLFRKAIAQFESSPLVGIGIEQGRFVLMDVELPESVKYKNYLTTEPINEHNAYMQILSETGVVGTMPYIIFILFLLIMGLKSTNYLITKGDFWSVGVFSSFISMSLHLWTITALRNTAAWVVYGLLGGVIMFAHMKSLSDLNSLV